jgi:Haem-dependent oxidative N-demethylase, alpha subunit-like
LEHICQQSLPFAPWLEPAARRLPGIQPLDMANWLVVEDAFAAQMALRDRLLSERRADVFGACDTAPAQELLNLVLSHLGPDYQIKPRGVIRPDGVEVAFDNDHPLVVAARLVQEDLCLLEQPAQAGEHVLTGAVLCFPASWTLAEKLGRPLTSIHDPVPEYADGLAARVQRLFDALHPDRPLWRANALLYDDPTLFQPRRHADRRARPRGQPPFLRSERQSLLRLPETRAVVFSIHTWVVAWENLSDAQRAGLAAHPVDKVGAAP